MSKSMLILLAKFSEISKLKWSKGLTNNQNSVGLTFENLLGKKADSEIFPDYQNIEIKCTQRYSNFPMGLFTKAFDGPNIYETNYILEKYGKNYSFIPNKKYLKVALVYNEEVLVNENYFFKLICSFEEQKIYINIYDKNKKLLDNPYIEFDTLKNHLLIKLSNLAVIYASKIEINGCNHFRYYAINFFKIKGFETFIDLITKGIITLNLECRVSLSKDYGKQKNKGIEFKIQKDKIDMLFERILDYDADKKEIKYYEV